MQNTDKTYKRIQLEKKFIYIVKKSRKSLPREGVRKLVRSLNIEFKKQKLQVGRDTLFTVLRENKTLTLRKKYSCRTTNSYHRFYKYNNLIIDIKSQNQIKFGLLI